MSQAGTVLQKDAKQLNELLGAGSERVQLVDVRSALEFESERIEQAVNIPIDDLGPRGGELKRDKVIALVCRSGIRASRAADTLASFGYETVVLSGGLLAWKEAGFAVKAGKKRISLERQVQLALGLILLLSVAAGWTLSQWFFVLPGLIGFGLTYAGLTGNCGLAMLLALAPWNRSIYHEPADRGGRPGSGNNCSQ